MFNGSVRIAAVIPTHDRKTSLRECLRSIQNQTRKLDEIIVIDNNSMDGTAVMIKNEFPQVTLLELNESTGSAGGFYTGLERARKQGFDWVWLMDDDAQPRADALSRLIDCPVFGSSDTGFLCSHVIWTDGTPRRMNIPHISRLVLSKGARLPFNTFLSDQNILAVSACTWASMLVSRKAIMTVGLPLRDFFLWVDDVEYANRITTRFRGYYIPKSIGVHATPLNINADISNDDARKLDRYFFDARNKVYFYRGQGCFIVTRTIGRMIRDSLKRKDSKLRAFGVIVRGIIAGFFFNPRITYVK